MRNPRVIAPMHGEIAPVAYRLFDLTPAEIALAPVSASKAEEVEL